jgi:hypothetical protein
MLLPVVFEPTAVSRGRGDPNRVPMQVCICGECQERLRHVDRHRVGLDGEVAEVEQAVHVASQEETTVVVMFTDGCVAVEMASLQC